MHLGVDYANGNQVVWYGADVICKKWEGKSSLTRVEPRKYRLLWIEAFFICLNIRKFKI